MDSGCNSKICETYPKHNTFWLSTAYISTRAREREEALQEELTIVEVQSGILPNMEFPNIIMINILENHRTFLEHS